MAWRGIFCAKEFQPLNSFPQATKAVIPLRVEIGLARVRFLWGASPRGAPSI